MGTLLFVDLIRVLRSLCYTTQPHLSSHQIYCILSCLMQAIAEESHSESKWKQLGELAMSAGKVRAYLK